MSKRNAFFMILKETSDTFAFTKRAGVEFVVGGYSFRMVPSLSSDDGVGISLLSSITERGGATAALIRELSAADRVGIEVELFARPDDNTREVRQ